MALILTPKVEAWREQRLKRLLDKVSNMMYQLKKEQAMYKLIKQGTTKSGDYKELRAIDVGGFKVVVFYIKTGVTETMGDSQSIDFANTLWEGL